MTRLAFRMFFSFQIYSSVLFSLLECNAGYYGNNCSSRCGHCLDNVTCHYITGNCLNGCHTGYEEPMCTEGNLLLL